MQMNRLSKYLAKANAFLISERARRAAQTTNDNNSLFDKNGEVQGEYPAFAASFSAAIIRSGLLPAVFIYTEKSGGGKSKVPLTLLLLDMIKEEGDESEDLKTYVLNHQAEGPRLRQRVIDASIAAKLALRTFPVANKNKPA